MSKQREKKKLENNLTHTYLNRRHNGKERNIKGSSKS